MTRKIKTISLQGKDYAQVKDRIKEFRTENPRGKIETIPQILDDGQVMFKAYILKDKEDEYSAEATGHAIGKNSGQKAFEKLETIAVGRALALLGYAQDGEIASSDEMEEYEAYKKEKFEVEVAIAKKKILATKNIEELAAVWPAIAPEVKMELVEIKNQLKEKYESNKVQQRGGVDKGKEGKDNGDKRPVGKKG